MNNSSADQLLIAVVIPYFQKKEGLLVTCLRSVFAQTYADNIHVVIVDDSSPRSAASELESTDEFPTDKITLIKQPNGGAGAARNKALDSVPEGTDFVAFIDSDDSWKPHHLENAVRTLQQGYDAYFSDWWSYNFPDSTNFERIKTLTPSEHVKVPNLDNVYELGMTPIEHILSDGGGVIQTSTVVYDFKKYANLRFREEFFNGQDFFFWMDMGELGAQYAFSTDVGCENGEGINIYQGSGWGTEHSLRRIRNELFVWVSTEKFYSISKELHKKNRRKIGSLQEAFARDILHRILRRKPINRGYFIDILKMTPSSIFYLLFTPFKVVFQSLTGK
ncbi:glycosyltransferase family 2 protein [Neptunicella marina]|uniref:Glycosyltransferase n=1 Tax=Neptunicella marina TaxID=2125989 RepID=A0A8J6ITS0_9ALTE|nr:glycosyltransferase family A protein [Neptunicella marina]MBC3765767.1 glycosyltransferase [Neptunicella marina]